MRYRTENIVDISAVRTFFTGLAFVALTLSAYVAVGLADGGMISTALAAAGQAAPGQMGLQDSVTTVMDDIIVFDNFLLYIITGVTLFVLALLLVIMVRFNARTNPEPSRTSHNTALEIAWTALPILILLAIAVPSFRLLYKQLEIPEADLTVKAVGYQWYWGYEYPDHGDFAFDSLMLEDDERGPNDPRLLAADVAMVVPVGKTVRVIVTGADVIHSFAVPSFGVKVDAIPGRLNETWFRAEKTGTYYGQCSELCGVRHAFMPIMVKVVTQDEFDAWLVEAQDEYASLEAPGQLAQLTAEQR